MEDLALASCCIFGQEQQYHPVIAVGCGRGSVPIRKDETSGIWQMDIRFPGVPRVKCSSGTADKQAAQEYHDKLKADLWRQSKLGEQPEHLFEEAALRFLHLSEGQSDYSTKLRHVQYWRDQFRGRAMRSLTADEIIRALPADSVHKMKQPTQPRSSFGQTRSGNEKRPSQ